MIWLQLKIKTTIVHTEKINAFLNLLGSVANTYQDAADQPILEPDLNSMPLWNEINIISLFDPNVDAEKIINFLIEELGKHAIEHYHIEQLAEQAWERVWLKDFKPMQFGNNLWICPSVMNPPDPNGINIILDPGLAFGTGTHPTTALCLAWLDANPPLNQTVIDYGCGSGILAIAALKLGAQEVFAIDHDPQALQATLDNAQRNSIKEEKLHTLLPEQFSLNHKVDTLMANILTQPLLELAPHFADLIKPKGNLVLSGILATQAEIIRHTYSAWFDIQNIAQKEEWVRINGNLR